MAARGRGARWAAGKPYCLPELGERVPVDCPLPRAFLLPHGPRPRCAFAPLAAADAKRRDEYLQRLMGPPNATWQQIIEQAKQNVEVLRQAEVIRNVQNILQVGAGAGACGAGCGGGGIGRGCRGCRLQ